MTKISAAQRTATNSSRQKSWKTDQFKSTNNLSGKRLSEKVTFRETTVSRFFY